MLLKRPRFSNILASFEKKGQIVYLILLESVSDKKDFEILVRDVGLKGTPPLKWQRYLQNCVFYQNLKVLFI